MAKYIPYWQEYFGRVRLTPFKFYVLVFCMLLVVLILAFSLVIYGNISTEREKKWIETANPRIEAEKAFQEKKISFLQIWVEKEPAEKGDPYGIWITPAEREIGTENLKRYRMIQLSTSSKWDEDVKPYSPKAMDFASKYNSRMTELVSGKK